VSVNLDSQAERVCVRQPGSSPDSRFICLSPSASVCVKATHTDRNRCRDLDRDRHGKTHRQIQTNRYRGRVAYLSYEHGVVCHVRERDEHCCSIELARSLADEALKAAAEEFAFLGGADRQGARAREGTVFGWRGVERVWSASRRERWRASGSVRAYGRALALTASLCPSDHFIPTIPTHPIPSQSWRARV
jgi:hypothetical protein